MTACTVTAYWICAATKKLLAAAGTEKSNEICELVGILIVYNCPIGVKVGPFTSVILMLSLV
jgi:hypothetical protein